jgi:transcriptional regulator with XRE-family HTH domain
MTTDSKLTLEFREVLLVLRRRAGLSQRHLAARIDRDHQTVSRWEKGDTLPMRVSDLVHLADVLGCTVDDLDPDGSIRSKCFDNAAA